MRRTYVLEREVYLKIGLHWPRTGVGKQELENPHGQRRLAGYSPWGCKELDTTERLSTCLHMGVVP